MRLARDRALGSGHNEAGGNEDCFEIDTAEDEGCSRAWAQRWMFSVYLTGEAGTLRILQDVCSHELRHSRSMPLYESM